MGVGEQFVGLGMQCHRHAIERHIPHRLFPPRLMVFHEPCLHARLQQVVAHSLKCCVVTGVVGQVDAAIALVRHPSRFRLRRADESQSGSQVNLGKHFLHIGLHADAILYEHHHRFGVEQWWQERWKEMVVHRLEAHQYHVALRHVAGMGIRPDVVEMEVTVARIHLQSVLLHIFIILVKKEMYLISRLCEHGTIVAANRSCSDNTVRHLFIEN